MKKCHIACILAAVLLAAASCRQETLYHTYLPIPSTGWAKGDTLTYTLPHTPAAQDTCTLTLGIRHKDTYPYRDIWLRLDTDTLHLMLADPEGHWHGHGIGELRQYTHRPIRIPATTDTVRQIRITHIMQDTLLQGIHDVGIEITRRQH